MNAKVFIFFLLFVNFFIQSKAQSDSSFITSDTILVSKKIPKVKEHKPTKAVLFSTFLPGLGQAYNKQYWKIPLFYSALGATAYSFDYNNKQYKTYIEAILNLRENQEDPTVQILEDFLDKDETTLTQEKDQLRRRRDLSALLFLASYAFNIIDATVYGHLINFDVNDDLSLMIQPQVIPLYTIKKQNTIGLSISFNF